MQQLYNCLKGLITALLVGAAASSPLAAAHDDYVNFKRIIAAMYNEGTLDGVLEPESDQIHLTGCGMGVVSAVASQLDYGLQEIAMTVEEMTRTLRHNGFPSAEWRSAVNSFEDQAVALARKHLSEDGEYSEKYDDEYNYLERSVVSSLAMSLGTSPTNGKQITEDPAGECGDGGLVAVVESRPPGATIWLQTEFDFRLCGASGNAWDPNGCGWREVLDREESVFAGTYRYLAIWPDGSTTRGRRSFMEDINPTEVDQFIVIRR